MLLRIIADTLGCCQALSISAFATHTIHKCFMLEPGRGTSKGEESPGPMCVQPGRRHKATRAGGQLCGPGEHSRSSEKWVPSEDVMRPQRPRRVRSGRTRGRSAVGAEKP